MAQDKDKQCHGARREEAICLFVAANTIVRDTHDKYECGRLYRQHQKKHHGTMSRHHAICTYDASNLEFMHNYAI